jgi:hypothetical protein
MATQREQFTFPTRQYPYRAPTTLVAEADQPDPALMMAIEPEKIYRFVLGKDQLPTVMSSDDAEKLLCDPFAELLLKRNVFPITLRNLLAVLDTFNQSDEGLPTQSIFLVADGGQVLWTPETAGVNRQFRFAVSRSGAGNRFLLISTSTVPDSETQFLQLLSWDEKNKVYNYYERRSGVWIWAGNSLDALAPETRHRGPFDSHVNGSLVMKELRAPWNNWHSMNASIIADALAPDDPLRNEQIFTGRRPAHEFENLVRSRITLWNSARLKHALSADGKGLGNVDYFLRQILTTTTVNLVTTDRPSALVTDDEDLILPTTFFINSEALFDRVGLDPDIAKISIKGKLYRDSLVKYDFTLGDTDLSTGDVILQKKGDTFFAFLVPEPAFEDLNVLEILLREKLISPKFAACLLMIDFQNPVFSAQRQKLMDFVPASAPLVDDPTLKSGIEAEFLNRIDAAAIAPGGPEEEFLQNWSLLGADWKQTFTARIEDYFAQLREKAATVEGCDGWVRLAESRRREFRRQPLAEFSLTLPMTNIPKDSPLLAMNTDGTIREK